MIPLASVLAKSPSWQLKSRLPDWSAKFQVRPSALKFPCKLFYFFLHQGPCGRVVSTNKLHVWLLQPIVWNRLKMWRPAADLGDPGLIDRCGGGSFINRAHPSASPGSHWKGRKEGGSQAEMSPDTLNGGEGPEALAQTLLTRAKVSQYLRMGQNGERVMVCVHLDRLLSFNTQYTAYCGFLIAVEMPTRMRNIQICIGLRLYKCSMRFMHAWLDFTVHHKSTTHDWQGPFSVAHSCQNCVVPSKRLIDVLGQVSFPPSSRLPPTLPALCYCVTPRRERACVGTLRPSVRKRRGWRSSRRAQGSKQYVRSSGTPIWLWVPSTDRPLFLLKLSFHSPQQRDSYAGVQWQGLKGGGGRRSDFKDIDRHFSIVKSLVIHLTTRTGHPIQRHFNLMTLEVCSGMVILGMKGDRSCVLCGRHTAAGFDIDPNI